MGQLLSNPAGRLVIVLSAALLLYSGLVHLVPVYNVVYVPLGITVVLILTFVATSSGMTLADLGLERGFLGSGLRWGAAAALLAAVVIGVGVLVPTFHGFFEDARVRDMSFGLLAYRALVRIPLGTALLEELAFRGVLFGAWRKVARPLWAALGSSVIFGLWHVRPSIELLDANGVATATAGRIGVVAGAVAVTTLAGLGFCWLRVRSHSLVAPYLAHVAINSLALIGAFIVNG